MSDLLHWMNVAYKWDKGKTSPQIQFLKLVEEENSWMCTLCQTDHNYGYYYFQKNLILAKLR